MKKVGYFFLSFLPFLIALVFQIAASLIMMGIGVIFGLAVPPLSEYKLSEVLPNLFSDTDFNACIMIIYSLMSICGFSIWYYRNFGGEFLPKPRLTFHPLHFAGIVLLVPGIQFATSYLIAILSVIFPSWLEEYMEILENAGLDNNLSPLMLTYAVLVGPIAEELIFRGVTLRSIRRVFPFWIANLFQAILFGCYHMNWLQGIYAGALGFILGFICEKGGSIYLSILLHILYNFWGTVITSHLQELVANEYILAGIMFGTMIVSLIVGGVIFHIGQVK